ncbi:hypothetical protein Tbd_1818 [Thiobacillus denitrificans ATCC 25259]|uniref:Uncharacterized protein n=1 Tax=Thiobacillus denitrificans (strain ATCC 25259 / T1) TaxID=292415 RepID=Q3SHW2_THIDA|nr:hypothetical protein [Thiobacillus denitrificans]AAZ97771.1 hypothetical protein Tbd_1818 [Thiobacillus denitrificans ATCC 25259]
MSSDNNKTVDLVARLVARGEHERADLVAAVARRQQAGLDPANDENGGGFDWRAFAVYFSQRYPGLTILAPFSVLCWIYLIYQLVAR